MSKDLNTVVAKYIELRDRKKELEKDLEEQLAPINEAMGRIEMFLLARMNADNVDSYRTDSGTPYKVKKTSATMADATMFKSFVMAPALEKIKQLPKELDTYSYGAALENILASTPAWHLVDFRVGKKGVEEYMEQNNKIPPGVNVTQTIAVNIRRS